MRRWLGLMLLVLFSAGCTTPAGEPDAPSAQVTDPASTPTVSAVSSTTTTRTTTTTTTTITTTTTTTITTVLASTTTMISGGPPPFFRYGSHGVTRVAGGTETVLVDVPVGSAWSDGVGGLLFTYHREVDEPRAMRRLTADTTEPEVVAPGGSVVNLDGRAAIVRYDDWDDRRCEEGSIGVYDLETGAREDFTVCFADEDVGWFPDTYGSGLFAGVRSDALGTCGTDSGILFWDRSGAEVDVVTNPYPSLGWDEVPDWIPCELDARMSPDGRLLAYRFRPDNKWPCPELDHVPYEDWLKQSRNIPGVVVVLDIETGTEIFRIDSEAEERLTDFDGRFLVLTTADRRWDVPIDQRAASTIVDITGTSPDHDVDDWVRVIWTHN